MHALTLCTAKVMCFIKTMADLWLLVPWARFPDCAPE